MADTQKKLRVAILGGGLSGVVLLRALLLKDNIDAHIFESRPVFKEEGAGIGFQPNALHSLNAISPALIKELDAAGAVNNEFRCVMGAGARAGTLLNTQQDETIRGWAGNISHKYVGRHAFLRELLSNVPEERMHADMRLERLIEGGEEGTTLIFADGSRQVFDVVVGADGINSRVRQHILADHPSRDPAYDGWWNALSLIPSELVVPIVGADVLNTEKPAQTMYAGEKGEGLLVSFVHGMEAVNVILVMRGGMQFTPEKYPMEVSKEDVLKTFERWPKNLGVDLVELVASRMGDPMGCWPLRVHKHAPTYVKGSIALMGDAAHTTSPWQGSGGAMAIEDALVLSAVLGQAKSTKEVPIALRAYDEVRRARTQRVTESSHGTGLIITGQDPEVGVDVENMARALKHRWDFIRDFGPIAVKAQAQAHMVDMLRAESK